MASRLSRIFETALIPLGLTALGVLVYQVGDEDRKEILALTSTVKWWFVPIVLQELVAHSVNTAALLACMPRDRIGFWYAFAARLAGEGVNATMPTATVGGELLKISLLSRRAPPERATAGVSAAYASQGFGQMLFTSLALPLSLPAIDLALPYRLFLAFCVFAGLVATYVLSLATRGSAFGHVHGVLRKIGIGREGSRTHEATARIDDAARAANEAHPRAFPASVLGFTFGWAWGVVEVMLVFHACGHPVDLRTCIAIESLAAFVDAVFFFVPGQLGTREVGLTGITTILGLDAPLGLSLGLVRRGRQLIWASVGLLCLAAFRARFKHDEPEPGPRPGIDGDQARPPRVIEVLQDPRRG